MKVEMDERAVVYKLCVRKYDAYAYDEAGGYVHHKALLFFDRAVAVAHYEKEYAKDTRVITGWRSSKTIDLYDYSIEEVTIYAE